MYMSLVIFHLKFPLLLIYIYIYIYIIVDILLLFIFCSKGSGEEKMKPYKDLCKNLESKDLHSCLMMDLQVNNFFD